MPLTKSRSIRGIIGADGADGVPGRHRAAANLFVVLGRAGWPGGCSHGPLDVGGTGRSRCGHPPPRHRVRPTMMGLMSISRSWGSSHTISDTRSNNLLQRHVHGWLPRHSPSVSATRASARSGWRQELVQRRQLHGAVVHQLDHGAAAPKAITGPNGSSVTSADTSRGPGARRWPSSAPSRR